MMARHDRHVKSDPAGGNTQGLMERCLDSFLAYIEAHPRTGWYIATLATLNFFLNLIDAFDLF
jgi:hypothetical protein